MRFWLTLVLAALVTTPALAHLPCGPIERFLAFITGPRFSETERESWEVESFTFHYYRNDTTGTYSIFYSFDNVAGKRWICILEAGVGERKQSL